MSYGANEALKDAKDLLRSKPDVEIETFKRLEEYLLLMRRNERIPELLRNIGEAYGRSVY